MRVCIACASRHGVHPPPSKRHAIARQWLFIRHRSPLLAYDDVSMSSGPDTEAVTAQLDETGHQLITAIINCTHAAAMRTCAPILPAISHRTGPGRIVGNRGVIISYCGGQSHQSTPAHHALLRGGGTTVTDSKLSSYHARSSWSTGVAI